MNDMAFLEQEGVCSAEEIALQDSQQIDWDNELAWLLGETQQDKPTREQRIADCGRITHSSNHLKELVTHLYLCGCLECPHCFAAARGKEIMRLTIAINKSDIYITRISMERGNAIKKHIRRHGGRYRQYPCAEGRDTYVIDEAAMQSLSKYGLRFKKLTEPMVMWERVLRYVPGRRRSGSLGRPRVEEDRELEEKVRLVFDRVIVNGITAKRKRSLWLEAMDVTPDAESLTVVDIQNSSNVCTSKWVELCENAGATTRSFGVRVSLVPISQLVISIRSCDMRPADAFAMCPDFILGIPTGIMKKREPERVLV